MTLSIYLVLGFCSFAFVLLPISGGVILNPILSLMVDPHTALSLSVFFFALNSGIKAAVFIKDIKKDYVLHMLPISIVASAVGSFAVGAVPEIVLYLVLLVMTVWFAYKRFFIQKKSSDNARSLTGFLVAAGLGGFMQGTGLGGGGSLRKAYFLSENMTLQQMHGTTSTISVCIGLTSLLVRLGTEQVQMSELSPMLLLIPVMVAATIFGKKVLGILSNKLLETVVAVTLLLMIALLLVKIFLSF